MVGGASGRTRAGREARAPRRQHTLKHFPAHAQAERAPEGRVRGREWGRGLVILVAGEGESDSSGPETSHARGSKGTTFAQRRGQGVLGSGGVKGCEGREAKQLAGPAAQRMGQAWRSLLPAPPPLL